jgi:hypothetical protein
MKKTLFFLVLCLSASLSCLGQEVRFNRDILPILSDNCFKCHGFDKNARKANLRLDTEAGAKALRGDHAPIVPSNLAKSGVWQRINAKEPALRMPPPGSDKSLKLKEIALLKRWIEQGAKWEGHWAYQPVVRSTPPTLDAKKWGSWAKNPVDRFLLARILKDGLTPSKEADKATLLRRLTLDLTGLPPTPQERRAFLEDKSPNAWEKAIQRALASPHYGERMAQYWLDLVRYADTVGYHGDQNVTVYPYRDYVIRAFNTNRRFDQFTREQLAGDLLPQATLEQRVASGYNKLGMMSTEGGIQDKEYRAKYAVDRVKNLSAVWLGSTFGCAECHDHKFDPITQKDFYQVAAFFADLNEKGFYESGYSAGDWGPTLRLPTTEQDRRLKRYEAEIEESSRRLEAFGADKLQAGQAQWEQHLLTLDRAKSTAWQALKPTQATSTEGATLTIEPNGVVMASGKLPAFETYQTTAPLPTGALQALRLDSLTDDAFMGNYAARAGHHFVISDIEVAIQHGNSAPEPVRLSSAIAQREDEGFPVSALIDGNPKTAWTAAHGFQGGTNVILRFAQPIQGGKDTQIVVRVKNTSAPYKHLGKFLLQVSQVPDAGFEANGVPDPILASIRKEPTKRTPEEQKQLLAHYRNIATETAAERQTKRDLERDKSLLLGEIPKTLVSEVTATPRVVRILPRGNWMDDSGEIVQAGIPAQFASIVAKKPKLNRLDLANWITAPQNPLTPRVFVNRLWKLFFGTGLSKSMEDFGLQGEAPLHAELLDWLASEFVRSGWDVKNLVRLIVTTSAYRQASVVRSDLSAKDPFNRLYARQSIVRLDAEVIRDVALRAGGLLSEKIGGASVFPIQPTGYLASLNFPRREWAADTGESLYRRGLYIHWQRTFLHPSLLTFDAPSREEATCTRNVSNTPLQSLVLLNDPNYVEAARGLASRMIQEGGKTFESRIKYAFAVVLSRTPKPKEERILQQLFTEIRKRYRADRASALRLIEVGSSLTNNNTDPIEFAAWVQVARALLNLHETITRS